MTSRPKTYAGILHAMLGAWGLVVVILLSACGGGTVGTGTGERSIEGRVLYTDGRAVEGAEVTILETGEADTTDSNGDFEISSETQSSEITLEVAKNEVRSEVKIDAAEGGKDAVRVDVELDPVSQHSSVSSLSVTAKIEGRCDPYFENKRTIRQSAKLGSGTVCPVNVRMRGNGRPLSRIPFIIEHSKCDGEKWTRDADGVTNQSGFGTTDFTFKDDDNHCLYRIVAPHEVKGLRSLTFNVLTFRAQKK